MTEQEKINIRMETGYIAHEVSTIARSLRDLASLVYKKANSQSNQEAFDGEELEKLNEIANVLYDTCSLIQSTYYQMEETTNDMIEDNEETLFL